MELSLTAFLIVCPLTFLAGFIDSIAGGGGLISLPAYLLAGLPMHFALGTNKLSSTMGAITASIRYYRNRFVDLFLCIPSIAAASSLKCLFLNTKKAVTGSTMRSSFCK
ncbi:hypothetical protein FACS189496_3580 [Bacilli bacterium]|nr:hypothetical protein FACS189496_3580 [Bacilli bacterium]